MRRGTHGRGSILLLTMTAGGLVLLAGCGPQPTIKPQAGEPLRDARVETVRLATVPDEIEAPGTVRSVATAQIAARTMGTVLAVTAREGDLVKRGQLLLQLDDRELAARHKAAQSALEEASAAREEAARAVAAAQAQADVASKTYERYVYLRDQKSVSPQEFDEVQARQRAALAGLEQAKARRQQVEAMHARAESEARAAAAVADYARVVAPFDGVVVRREVEPGTVVMQGASLLVVEDTSRYRLEATVDASDANALRRGTPARVQFDAIPGKDFGGTVSEIEAGAESASHTVRVKVDLPKDPALRSGFFGRAWFRRGERSALVIPRSAIVERGQLRGVYALDQEQVARLRLVTLGQSSGPNVEVLSGLTAGDRILLDVGGRELDGRKVESVR